MSESEIQKEIQHHQLGCKARLLKETRMEALAKARASRAKSTEKEEEMPDVKVPEIKKTKTKTEPAPQGLPKKEEKKVVKKESSVDTKAKVEDKKPSSRSSKMMKVEDD